MTKTATFEDPVGAVALLDEPKRRLLYDLVAGREVPLGRDEAAAALGMSRELAAFHLDRLVVAGLLETEYRRLGTRTGPGAGRPAKLYRRADREIAVSFPPRDYDRVAEDFAEALDRVEGKVGARAAADVARARGQADGIEARRSAGPRPSRGRLRAALLQLLRSDGYEPEVEVSSGNVCLRNCPYHALAASHRDLTCGTNLAWAEGVVKGLADTRLNPELASAPGYCCVRFNAS
ncbi:MAG: transcriptional regulator [Chloroflexota bacterium]